ncbi:MAG: hypothetical protein IPG32_07230 [Saprospirales bacterium]|nr:hypothetical protein [Saprospirales bacterium]
MKKISTTFLISFWLNASFFAQQTLPTDNTNLQNFHLAVIPVLSDEHVFQVGYEKALGPRQSLVLDFGIGYNYDKTELEPFREDNLIRSGVRACQNGVIFVFLIPFPVIETCKTWNETEKEKITDYVHSNVFVSGNYNLYFARFSKQSKTLNGLYISPGLTLGHRSFTRYIDSEGDRADIEVLDSDFDTIDDNPWGIIIGGEFVGNTKIIDEDYYTWSQRTREDMNRVYVRPNFKAGAAIPFAKIMTADLGAQVNFFGPNQKYIRVSPVAKLSAWF